MGLSVTLVSGPRRSGKSLVAALIIDEVVDHEAHYVRLSAANGSKRPPVGVAPPEKSCDVASAQWLCYEHDRVFEMLPEMLAAIHKRDRFGQVIIEADADSVLAHAYPYDQQFFVVPAPRSLDEMFRSSVQAARALQDVLDDTAEFAAEVFGLPHGEGYPDDDTREEHILLSKSEVRVFLDTPLGNQLATRIQLHPAYHGLVESDAVLVNTAAGEGSTVVDGCCRRLERLLSRVQGAAHRPIFCCNPADPNDPRRSEFIDSLKSLCASEPRW